jgi:hypothetical protein
MHLPRKIEEACAPLFAALPLEQAMPHLLGSHPKQTELVESVLRHPALANRPELASALWLYVDDLDRSHTISQGIETTTGSYWHGIMHRREGDFGNSRYWHHRAAGHPLLAEKPEGLVREVENAKGEDTPALVAQQREEWAALFAWCAQTQS